MSPFVRPAGACAAPKNFLMTWRSTKQGRAQSAPNLRPGPIKSSAQTGYDTAKEEQLLEVIREHIGPSGKLRVDLNPILANPVHDPW